MSLARIYGGKIVTPDKVIENGTVTIENGIIVEISSQNIPFTKDGIDASGKWIFPGIIDTHSDSIEREIQPRPGSFFPVDISLSELERKLVGQGITTIHHSLSMMGDIVENMTRSNDQVLEYIQFIKQYSKERFLLNHKVHLRYEITNLEAFPLVEGLLKSEQLDQISFMDHTPGQGQWKNVEIHKKFLMSRKNATEIEINKLIEERMKLPKLDIDKLHQLAQVADAHNIPLASHDDDSIEKFDIVKDWNVRISEFPLTLDVAIEAKRRGLYVVMGAPNVLLGRSHSNNLSAKAAIEAGVVDILCSDYYPSSLIQSIFLLYYQGLPIHEAVNMISLNPARALGVDNYTGSLEEGKDADLLIVNEFRERPIIENVLVSGKNVYSINYNYEKIVQQ